ncbi:DeoR/GlpR family DNA-binding transcription regulator [Streptomyces sp. NBC_01186]|uniref:DeoR/GlpR family DNA-binding transcription regulator n=1 Tax=Streptomyces sp. NBC_01186 TaxID=2903765 RepID=UPI002E1060CE|nr:DeoR/GlpR family DNA-binding transcription regulator [Streptomyces sp. NBC_01186]
MSDADADADADAAQHGASSPSGASGASRQQYAAERQQALLRAVRVEGRLDAAETAERLGVSAETIRRDLVLLERQGLLRRQHGGAVPAESLSLEPPTAERTGYQREKRRIAQAALEHVPAEGSVLLDAGSTTACLAEMFPGDRELTVFTNTLPLALTLVGKPRLDVHTLGGRVRARTLAEVDHWAMRTLSEIRVDVAFLGTNAISVERGLSTPDTSEAAIKRLMYRTARRRVLLADHHKVGRERLYQYAELSDIDLLITDTGLSDKDAAQLTDAGIREILRA